MARITMVEVSNMNDDQLLQYRRFPANLTRALLRTSDSTAAYLSLGASFRKTKLSAKDRELVILRVGALSSSEYERMQHLPIAHTVGWTDGEIASIESGDQVALGERDGTILRFVDECVYKVRVSDNTLLAARRFMTEQEVAEMTLLIGHYMMTARFLETLGVDLDDQATSWSALAPVKAA
ncbi:carboxymuconolactone decarboxylase family protein [Caballeronia sp. LjRoot34]|uniref:carboxymuconolactone decarboxylase family protein n=1 Tax=Caballeronia sp. LjRoot34 TaxID=3342325 RepID=UPI003ED035F7